jgi:hypothetical protein
MIHLFIAYDDLDTRMGEYFSASKEHLYTELQHHCAIQLFDTNSINTGAIETAISVLNTENPNTPFVFVNYTHGEVDNLHTHEKEFVNAANAYYFGSSLFYACSCWAGVGLKASLMANDCTFFMGYKGSITVLYHETVPLFYICENSVIIAFLSKNTPIIDSIATMYQQYNDFIENPDIDSTTRAVLRQNQSHFVYQGNSKIMRSQFVA